MSNEQVEQTETNEELQEQIKKGVVQEKIEEPKEEKKPIKSEGKIFTKKKFKIWLKNWDWRLQEKKMVRLTVL